MGNRTFYGAGYFETYFFNSTRKVKIVSPGGAASHVVAADSSSPDDFELDVVSKVDGITKHHYSGSLAFAPGDAEGWIGTIVCASQTTLDTATSLMSVDKGANKGDVLVITEVPRFRSTCPGDTWRREPKIPTTQIKISVS